MATYVSLVRYTDQGIRNIEQSPERLDAAKKAFQARSRRMNGGLAAGRSVSAVNRVRPPDLFRRLRGSDVEVHDDRLLPAPDHDARERLVTARVDLLMRDERWDEDEVPGAGLGRRTRAVRPSASGHVRSRRR